MKSTNHPSNNDANSDSKSNGAHNSRTGKSAAPKDSKWGPKPSIPPDIRTSGREYVNPVDYDHPYDSMARFADFLALRYDANRTRHAYYRNVRLLHQHYHCDPADILEAQLRDYFLCV